MTLRQTLLHFINIFLTHAPYLLQDCSAKKQPSPIDMQAGSEKTQFNHHIVIIVAVVQFCQLNKHEKVNNDMFP